MLSLIDFWLTLAKHLLRKKLKRILCRNGAICMQQRCCRRSRCALKKSTMNQELICCSQSLKEFWINCETFNPWKKVDFIRLFVCFNRQQKWSNLYETALCCCLRCAQEINLLLTKFKTLLDQFWHLILRTSWKTLIWD